MATTEEKQDKMASKVQLTLSVGGMTCATCSGAIEKGLKMVDGISSVLSLLSFPIWHLLGSHHFEIVYI